MKPAYLYFPLLLVFLVFTLGTKVLATKELWKDEAYSALYSLGHSNQSFSVDSWVNKKALVDSNFESTRSGFTDVMVNLSHEEPQHPPLYYLTLSVWSQVFGTSIFALRSLSFVYFFASVFAAFFLFKNWGDGTFALRATSILTVCPYFFVFAQEAREYSLILFLGILSTNFLVRKRWVLFSLSAILSLYSSLFSLQILIAQTGFAFFAMEKSQRKNFFLASGVALLSFIPWIIVLISNWKIFSENTAWLNTEAPPLKYIATVVGFISRAFFDPYLKMDMSVGYLAVGVPVALSVLAIAAFYVRAAIKNMRPLDLFALCLIVISLGTTVGLDLINGGGSRALSGRFWIGTILGLQLLVATRVDRKIYYYLVALGLFSIFVNSQAETWWNKGNLGNNLEISRYLNQQSDPYIVAENAGSLLSLAIYLNEDAKMTLIRTLPTESIPTNLFFVKLSPTEVLAVESKLSVHLIEISKGLWKIDSKI